MTLLMMMSLIVSCQSFQETRIINNFCEWYEPITTTKIEREILTIETKRLINKPNQEYKNQCYEK
jgi:hypothetical protein